MIRRAVSLLLAAVLAVAVGLILDAVDALPGVETAAVDARFGIRGTQQAPDDVVLVAVDDRTIAAGEGREFPINRKRHAEVIGKLAAAGAAVIAYDISFTEPSDDPEADDALVQAVHDAPTVVLGTTEVARDGTTAIFGGGEGLEYSGATPANTTMPTDGDGVIRRMRSEIRRLETFAIAAARAKEGGRIATPPGGSAWIDFPGGPGSIETISFLDVERDRVDPAALRGKVVVVGPTAAAARDIHHTPTSDRMPGPEIQAAATATALAGFPLRDAGWWLGALTILVLGAIGPLVTIPFGRRAGLIATGVALVVLLAVAQLAFNAGTILKVVPAFVAGLVGAIGAVAMADPERPVLDAVLDWLTRGVTGNLRARRLRALLLLCSALAVTVVALIALETDALRRPELSTVDMRFDVRGTEPPPEDVVIVAIDDKTLVEPPKPRWPFPRSHHARVIRRLAQAGAKVIAYDIQFSEPDPNGADGDRLLVEAAREAGNVVMATTEVDEHGRPNVFTFDIPTLDVATEEILPYSRAVGANSNYLTDTDGRIRRSYFQIQNREAFPLASARLAQGGTIQPPAGDHAWIDFVGGPGAIKRLSFVDIRRGTFDPRDVRGKVVVVGATAPSLQDLHATATTHAGLMPGPEVHANAIHTALEGFPLRTASSTLNWLLVIAMALLTPLVALRRGIALSVAVGLAAIAALLVGAQLAFNAGTIVAVVYPFAAGVAAILATSAIHGLTVAFEREQARDAFARFVPEAVVDQVLADAEGVRLGGVRREGTVMFSDLRGFTSFSETLEPERVIEALNRYLSEMSEAILDHGGTLVAYMGDGIMAVFGAPLQQDDHADRALEAAREMLARLERFNQWLRDQGLHDGFKMGIGLNSGPVMSGNVGSERRLEYTALGDTTNTAARLEGMTKGTPHQLFLSDTTKQRLTRPADDLIPVGEHEVRGRKAKVRLWSLREQPEPAEEAPEGAAEESAAAAERPTGRAR